MDNENATKECEEGRQCNPTFPSDLELDETSLRGDAIGDTLYSERWVIKILMKLVQMRDEDWTSDFETELCLLWDMSMDPDVVNLLMEHQFLQLSSRIIRSTTVPRVTEIMVGIIGNLSCVQHVRTEISRDKNMILLLLELLSMPDALVLVQLTRLIQTCVWEHRTAQDSLWLKQLCDDRKWIGSIGFILTSSTNEELLASTLALLDTLCYMPCEHELVGSHCASPDVVNAVIEASKQLYHDRGKDGSDIDKAACHSAQILSCFASFTEGREALGGQAETLSAALCSHLMTESPDSVTEYRVNLILAAVTVMGTILDVCGYFDPQVFNCFLTYLVHFQEHQNAVAGDVKYTDVLENLAQYFRLIVQVADKDLLATVLQDCSPAQVQILQTIMTDK